jgi:hypothetical protein
MFLRSEGTFSPLTWNEVMAAIERRPIENVGHSTCKAATQQVFDSLYQKRFLTALVGKVSTLSTAQ